MENWTRRRSNKRNSPNDSSRLSDWKQENIFLVITDILFNPDFVPVSLGLYCRNKKIEEPSIVEFTDFIQKARSQAGHGFVLLIKFLILKQWTTILLLWRKILIVVLSQLCLLQQSNRSRLFYHRISKRSSSNEHLGPHIKVLYTSFTQKIKLCL